MTKQGEAKGIHDHPTRKLGRRPPKGAAAIELGNVLTGEKVTHPAAADHFHGVRFTMGANDKFGVCGPTGTCNLVRLVSTGLLGAMIAPSLADEFDLYRRSGNPGFNPNLAPDDPNQEDNGVDMQTMLEALLSGGIGDGKGGTIKPVAFARVKVDSIDELDAAVSIFGGCLWGVDLQVAQQKQTDAQPPKWDYKRSSEWGGHCVMNGKYEEATKDAEVISWDEDVQTTDPFRVHQLQEAWVLIWPWNIAHPAFQQGVDLAALGRAYKDLTGAEMPGTPASEAGQPDAADLALWNAVKSFVTNPRVYGRQHALQDALKAWGQTKGYLSV